MPESPDTCRRKPYPERKSCGFKSIRIRADGASNGHYHRLRPLKKETSNQPVSIKVLFFLHKFVKFHDFSMKQVCKLKGRQFPCFMSPGVEENDWINDRRQLEVSTHRLVSSFQGVKANDWKTPGATFFSSRSQFYEVYSQLIVTPKCICFILFRECFIRCAEAIYVFSRRRHWRLRQ